MVVCLIICPGGTGLNPSYKTHIIELRQGNRGIVEFTYDKPGMFMFHAHINGFTDLGWMGMFNVMKNGQMKSLDEKPSLRGKK